MYLHNFEEKMEFPLRSIDFLLNNKTHNNLGPQLKVQIQFFCLHLNLLLRKIDYNLVMLPLL